ncbi:hypothetical protein DH2020_031875 [Rehmannia glutinosa]|uniref:FBD domain-containing protein n=1 Tax=Rehmannia glutinosa TaxID=99300 RepID=A0ABR0VJ66_REHGL
MEKTKPCTSTKRQKQNPPSVDRLSGLPDAVICQILSFLPTKRSVATSILAKRWRFLWTHVPNLDFDGENHNIINRVIMLHKVQSLTTFRLRYTYNCEDYEFETWITIAIARNVQNLDIRLDYQFMLPRCLFTCKTLVNLTLHNCVCIPSSDAVSLPSLKKLGFYSVRYQVDEALPHLLSCCPVLEELIIDGIVDTDLFCYDIFSPTIKVLNVFLFYHRFGYDPNVEIKINAPALRYLQLRDYVCKQISAQMLTSLIQANIVCCCFHDGEHDYYFQSVVKFIDSLCNVKYLKLRSDMELEPDGDFADPSECIRRFDNLTKLELVVDWRFFTKFLESADNLEILVIRKVDGSKKCNWVKPKQVPTCLLSHLRTVRIDHFGSTKHELKLVKYLLKNAKVLKRMEVYSPKHEFDFKAKFDALRKISLFQRGSEACELAFH